MHGVRVWDPQIRVADNPITVHYRTSPPTPEMSHLAETNGRKRWEIRASSRSVSGRSVYKYTYIYVYGDV